MTHYNGTITIDITTDEPIAPAERSQSIYLVESTQITCKNHPSNPWVIYSSSGRRPFYELENAVRQHDHDYHRE